MTALKHWSLQLAERILLNVLHINSNDHHRGLQGIRTLLYLIACPISSLTDAQDHVGAQEPSNRVFARRSETYQSIPKVKQHIHIPATYSKGGTDSFRIRLCVSVANYKIAINLSPGYASSPFE